MVYDGTRSPGLGLEAGARAKARPEKEVIFYVRTNQTINVLAGPLLGIFHIIISSLMVAIGIAVQLYL